MTGCEFVEMRQSVCGRGGRCAKILRKGVSVCLPAPSDPVSSSHSCHTCQHTPPPDKHVVDLISHTNVVMRQGEDGGEYTRQGHPVSYTHLRCDCGEQGVIAR